MADVWRIFGMNHMIPNAARESVFESGHTSSTREFGMALWYAEHSNYAFRIVYGDKECFHLAWRFLGIQHRL